MSENSNKVPMTPNIAESLMLDANSMKKVKKPFDQKEYNHKYYENKKNIKTICNICGGKSSPFNKFQHEQTKKHQNKLEQIKSATFDELSKQLVSRASELGLKININILNETETLVPLTI